MGMVGLHDVKPFFGRRGGNALDCWCKMAFAGRIDMKMIQSSQYYYALLHLSR
jgi:hypothetical protein